MTEPKIQVILVMGVAGSGKTTIGRRLAELLDWRFLDADDFHSPASRQKMAASKPLDDNDRVPWLDRLRRQIDCHVQGQPGTVLACSALKRDYRQRLGADRTTVAVVFLNGSRRLLEDRLRTRRGHFMPAEMLDSQLAALEVPTADESALIVDIDPSPEVICSTILESLSFTRF